MRLQRQWLYRVEVAAAVASAALLALTLVDPQWFERFFDASPDGGDGSLEWWLTIVTCSATLVVSVALAWRERRRVATAADPAR